MDQMMFVRDWSVTEPTLIANFVAATSFNADNASYVIKSVAYGLGHTKVQPIYQPTVGGQAAPAPQAKAAPSYNGMLLDKTPSQIERLGEAARRKYKEAAEAYLESIIEFKSDFEKDLGVKLNTYVEFDEFGNIQPKFEINGKIKVKYDYSIMFYVLLYDKNDRMMCKEEIYVGTRRKPFEVVDTCIGSETYHRVGNIKRIVVYWSED